MEINSVKQDILCACAHALDLPHSHLPVYVNCTADGVFFAAFNLSDIIIINMN
jgi:hypothetical protein